MKNRFKLTRVSASGLLVLALVLTEGLQGVQAQFARKQSAVQDFDTRYAKSPSASGAQNQSLVGISQLQNNVPGLQIDYDPLIKSPKFIHSTQGFLTGINGQSLASPSVVSIPASKGVDGLSPVRGFLDENQSLFGFNSGILNSASIKRDSTMADSGLRTTVWEQKLDGISVFEAVMIANLTRNGELVTLSSQFVPNASVKADAGTPNRTAFQTSPPITSVDALLSSSKAIGEGLATSQINVTGRIQGEGHYEVLDFAPAFSAYVRQVWVPLDASNLRLAWEVLTTSRKTHDSYQLLVDAQTGSVIVLRRTSAYLSDASYRVFTSDSPSPFTPSSTSPSPFQPPLVARDLITTNAFSLIASPNGWINDGDNETLGNNINAFLDRNADGQPDSPRPQGNPTRVFDFPLDLTQAPITYSNAAITELFYWGNVYHDILYGYGFTESAGNYQTDNFGRGGTGGDAILAHTQDGADVGQADNSFFAFAPDGIPGVVHMFEFSGPSPRRDGDLDQEVILHELTHGTSGRLVGGGIGITAIQSAGMGEGWSDYMALSILSQNTDDPDGVYAFGGYVTYLLAGTGILENYYFGIRNYPYSTDMTKNPLTFKDIDPTQISPHLGVPLSPLDSPFNPAVVNDEHHNGEILCVTLWDVRANLVHKYGNDVGNRTASRLVIDGMKLGPANPNFLQTRDAIILADQVNNGGANFTEIWKGFAKRGMGVNAVSPASTSLTGVVENYELPGITIVATIVSGGNANGVIDFNECNSLQITLKNVGAQPATGVSARLSTTTPGAQVSQPVSLYPDMLPGASVMNLVPYSLSTSPNFICGTPIVLNLVIKSDQETRTNQFQLASGVPGTAIRFDNGSTYQIPDANAFGVNSPIGVSGVNSAVGKVTVAVNITHTYVSDLILRLIGPDGTSCILSSQNGGSGQNYGNSCADGSRTIFDDSARTPIGSATAPFVGTFAPDNPLAVFNGKSGNAVNGTWRLHVVDRFFQDVGTINCWSLLLSPATCSDGGGSCSGVDLAVGIVASPSPVTLGGNITYTIGVTNNGPQIAKAVSMNQTLPSGSILISSSATRGSIISTGDSLNCNLGTMDIGDFGVITVVVAPTSVGDAVSTVSVGGSVQENDPSNNSASVVVPVRPIASDLSVAVSASPNPAALGSSLVYTVAVTNYGPYPATSVYVTNTLPAGVTFVDASSSQGASTVSGNQIICNVGTIGTGGSGIIQISVIPNALGTIIFKAQIANAAQLDPVPGNNTVTFPLVVTPAADLSVIMTGTPSSVILNSNVTYAIGVNNQGPSPATGVILTDHLPAGVKLVAATSSQGTISTNGSTLSFNIGSLNSGVASVASITISATNIGTLVNSASVSSSQADPNLNNNVATVTSQVATRFTNIVAAGSVLVNESFSPTNGAVDIGETVTVALRLQNTGNVANGNLVATLLPGNGVSSPSAAQTYGTLAAGGLPVSRNFTFTALGSSGGSVTAILQLQDGARSLGTVQFVYSLPSTTRFASLADIAIPDSGPGNPYPSVIPVSGLSGLIGKVTVTLTNLNHTYPHDVDILVTSPNGSKVLLDSHAGGGFGVTNLSLTFDDAASLVLPATDQIFSGTYKPTQYEAANLPTGAPLPPYDIVLSTMNGASANGNWSLYVADESAGDAGVILGGWSLAITTITPVDKVADLLLTGFSTPNPVLVASNLTTTFVISNRGPDSATGIAFTNLLSTNLVFISASSTYGTVLTNGNGVYCVFTNTLAAGSSASISIVSYPTIAGSITNFASALGNEVDLNQTNNTMKLITVASPASADLGVTVACTNSSVVGSNLTYTLTLTNNGPDTALAVLVTNIVPAGMTNIQVSSSAGSAVVGSGGVVSAALGALVPGSGAVIIISGNPGQLGPFTSTSTISSASSDPAAANNTAVVVGNIVLPSPIIVASGSSLITEGGTPPNGTVDLGETVTIGLRLANVGSADTANLTATLQPTSQVNPISGSQNFGSLVHGGAAQSMPFTFTVTGSVGGLVTASLLLQDGTTNLGTVDFTFNLPVRSSFSSSGLILIPDHGPSAPYPSTINVAGLSGLVSKVTVTIANLSHQFPNDINALLVGPQGQNLLLMSGSGGGYTVNGITLTFDDSGTATLPSAALLLSGTYRPSDNDPNQSLAFPSPARPYGGSLSVFNGTDPNGNWQLFVFDSSAGDSGSIGNGWSLAITTVQAINPVADLAVSQVTASSGSIYPGRTFSYVTTVANHGPANATDIVLNDSIPAGLTISSVTASQGTVTNNGNQVVANLGNLALQAEATVSVTVYADTVGTYSNVVMVAGSTTDLYLGNNSASAFAVVQQYAPFNVSGGSINASGQFEFNITGAINQIYTVQASSDLLTWTNIAAITLNSPVYKYVDTDTGSNALRFYRVMLGQ